MSEIERLRGLLAEGTPGPWEVEATGVDYDDDGDDSEVESGWFRGPQMIDRYDYETLRFTDAALIVAAVNALPALLDVAEAARRAENVMSEEHGGCESAGRCFNIGHSESRHFLREALDRLDGAS